MPKCTNCSSTNDMKEVKVSYAFEDARGKNQPPASMFRRNGHPIMAVISTIVGIGKHLGLKTYRCTQCGHECKRPHIG